MKFLAAALFLALSIVPSVQAAPKSVDRLEASVNSALILSSDVASFRKTLKLRSQLDPLFSGTRVAAHGEAATDEEIIQFLIDDRLISQLFPVTDTEVEQEVNSIQSNNHIDRTTLKNALREQGFTFDDYFELIRASASKRNLIDRDIRTKVTISDDDVKNYYYNHYAQKNEPSNREYQLRIILVSPKSYKNPSAARDTALRGRKQIEQGESFDEVAKRISEDSSSEVSTITEDQMNPLIREAVKNLKPGEVSSVVGNPKAGYYIIQLVDVKLGESKGLSNKVKEEIRTQLVSAEYQHQISLWLERQRQSAFIHLAGQSPTLGIPGQNQ